MKWSGIALAVVFTALLLRNAASQPSRQSAMVSPAPFTVLTNWDVQTTNAFLTSGEGRQTLQPLNPGRYQTHPYAMTLVVPAPVDDDCKMQEPRNIDPRMPRLRPKIEIIPESTAEK